MTREETEVMAQLVEYAHDLADELAEKGIDIDDIENVIADADRLIAE
jgi:hypothetical protein